MARSGRTDVTFNGAFFDNAMRDPRVQRVTDGAAQRALGAARASAPVDTAAYRDALQIEHRDSAYRRATRVVGRDPKTMLIESKTGNLARALKAAKQ